MEDLYAETEDVKPSLHGRKRPAYATTETVRHRVRRCPTLMRTSSISSTSSTSSAPASPCSTSTSKISTGSAAAAAAGGGARRYQQPPVIIHTMDDKPIHVSPGDFSLVVQTATGNPKTRHALTYDVMSAAASGRISTESLPYILPEIEPNITSNPCHTFKPNYSASPKCAANPGYLKHNPVVNKNPNPILFPNPKPNCELSSPLNPTALLQNFNDGSPNPVSDVISSDCTTDNTDSAASLQQYMSNYDSITALLNNTATSFSDISSDGFDDELEFAKYCSGYPNNEDDILTLFSMTDLDGICNY